MPNVTQDDVEIQLVSRGKRHGGSSSVVPPVGVNLAAYRYYSNAWIFLDVMTRCAGWSVYLIGGGDPGTLNTDSNGWPLLDTVGAWDGGDPGDQRVRTQLFLNASLPYGDYTILYEGKGLIVMSELAAFVGIVSDVPGKLVVTLDGTKSCRLVVYNSDPADPIKNIRIIMPNEGGSDYEADYLAGARFHPTFLNLLRDMDTIRFMDWQHTNDPKGQGTDWSKRATEFFMSQAINDGTGVAIEWMCELCNEIDANMYPCIPHEATLDYTRSMAELIFSRLDPNLGVVLEHSNEVWNPGFPQYHYMVAQAGAAGIGRHEFYAQQAVDRFDIFVDVFGGTERLTRVIGTQAYNIGLADNVLDHVYNGRPIYEQVDAMAIAPYISFRQAYPIDITWTIADLDQAWSDFASCLQYAIAVMQSNAAFCVARSIKMIAYEGEQHIDVGSKYENITELIELFHALNDDPRMRGLMREYYQAWQDAGGDLFCKFNFLESWSKFGSWSWFRAMTSDVDIAHKFLAATDFMGIPRPIV